MDIKLLQKLFSGYEGAWITNGKLRLISYEDGIYFIESNNSKKWNKIQKFEDLEVALSKYAKLIDLDRMVDNEQ